MLSRPFSLVFIPQCTWPLKTTDLRFVLSYHPASIIISETADGLQNAMNKLNEYCETWSLTVNTTKTKCMVTKGNNKETISLKFKDTSIECVTNFKYLGLEVSHDGNNDLAKNELYKRGLKAYFKLCSTLNPRPNPSMGGVNQHLESGN